MTPPWEEREKADSEGSGTSAWKKRVAKARAAGKKSIKVGNRRVSIVGGPSSAKGARESRKAKSYRTAPKAERKAARRSHMAARGRRRVAASVAARTVRCRQSRRCAHHHQGPRQDASRDRDCRQREEGSSPASPPRRLRDGEPAHGRGALRGRLDDAARTRRRRHEQWVLGDARLTGTGPFTDTPPTATTGTTVAYPGMKNGAAVLAPMNLTRSISGGIIVAAPFIGAAFVKAPVARSALQLFGFGALARIGGKALVDLFSGLLGSTSIGQQLYVNELAAAAQYQVAQGQTTTIQLRTVRPSRRLTGAATGLAGRRPGMGRAMPGGCGCCGSCAQGRPCAQNQAADLHGSSLARSSCGAPRHSPARAGAPHEHERQHAGRAVPIRAADDSLESRRSEHACSGRAAAGPAEQQPWTIAPGVPEPPRTSSGTSPRSSRRAPPIAKSRSGASPCRRHCRPPAPASQPVRVVAVASAASL